MSSENPNVASAGSEGVAVGWALSIQIAPLPRTRSEQRRRLASATGLGSQAVWAGRSAAESSSHLRAGRIGHVLSQLE